eukprot:345549_1
METVVFLGSSYQPSSVPDSVSASTNQTLHVEQRNVKYLWPETPNPRREDGEPDVVCSPKTPFRPTQRLSEPVTPCGSNFADPGGAGRDYSFSRVYRSDTKAATVVDDCFRQKIAKIIESDRSLTCFLFGPSESDTDRDWATSISPAVLKMLYQKTTENEDSNFAMQMSFVRVFESEKYFVDLFEAFEQPAQSSSPTKKPLRMSTGRDGIHLDEACRVQLNDQLSASLHLLGDAINRSSRLDWDAFRSHEVITVYIQSWSGESKKVRRKLNLVRLAWDGGEGRTCSPVYQSLCAFANSLALKTVPADHHLSILPALFPESVRSNCDRLMLSRLLSTEDRTAEMISALEFLSAVNRGDQLDVTALPPLVSASQSPCASPRRETPQTYQPKNELLETPRKSLEFEIPSTPTSIATGEESVAHLDDGPSMRLTPEGENAILRPVTKTASTLSTPTSNSTDTFRSFDPEFAPFDQSLLLSSSVTSGGQPFLSPASDSGSTPLFHPSKKRKRRASDGNTSIQRIRDKEELDNLKNLYESKCADFESMRQIVREAESTRDEALFDKRRLEIRFAKMEEEFREVSIRYESDIRLQRFRQNCIQLEMFEMRIRKAIEPPVSRSEHESLKIINSDLLRRESLAAKELNQTRMEFALYREKFKSLEAKIISTKAERSNTEKLFTDFRCTISKVREDLSTKISDLQSKLKLSNEENSLLVEQRDSLEADLERRNLGVTQQQTVVESLSADAQELQEITDDQKITIEKHLAAIKDDKAVISERNKEIAELTKNLAELTDRLESEKASHETTQTDLRESKSRADTFSERVGMLRSDLDQARGQVSELHEECKETTDKLETAQTKHTELHRIYDETKLDLLNAKTEIINMKSLLKSSEQNCTKLDECLKELQAKEEQTQALLSKAMSTAEKASHGESAIQQHLSSQKSIEQFMRSEIDGLKQKLDRAESRHSALEAECREVERQRSSAELAQHAFRMESERALADCRSDVARLEKTAERDGRQAEKTRAAHDSLKEKFETAQQRLRDISASKASLAERLEELKRELAEATASVADREDEIEQLQREVRDGEKYEKSESAIRDRLLKARSDLAASEKSNKKLTRKLDSTKSDLDALRSKYDSTSKRLNEISATTEVTSAELKSLNHSKQDLEMELTESRAEIRAKSDELGALTGKLAAQRARADQLEQSELSLNARARESEHALRKAERTSEKLGAQVENERANAEHLQKRIGSLSAQQTASSSELEQHLRDQIKELEDECKLLQVRERENLTRAESAEREVAKKLREAEGALRKLESKARKDKQALKDAESQVKQLSKKLKSVETNSKRQTETDRSATSELDDKMRDLTGKLRAAERLTEEQRNSEKRTVAALEKQVNQLKTKLKTVEQQRQKQSASLEQIRAVQSKTKTVLTENPPISRTKPKPKPAEDAMDIDSSSSDTEESDAAFTDISFDPKAVSSRVTRNRKGASARQPNGRAAAGASHKQGAAAKRRRSAKQQQSEVNESDSDLDQRPKTKQPKPTRQPKPKATGKPKPPARRTSAKQKARKSSANDKNKRSLSPSQSSSWGSDEENKRMPQKRIIPPAGEAPKRRKLFSKKTQMISNPPKSSKPNLDFSFEFGMSNKTIPRLVTRIQKP